MRLGQGVRANEVSEPDNGETLDVGDSIQRPGLRRLQPVRWSRTGHQRWCRVTTNDCSRPAEPYLF